MPSRMPSRLDSLQSLRDLSRGVGVTSARLNLDELEDLLALVKAASDMMRGESAISLGNGRARLDMGASAFAKFMSRLEYLTYSPCDEEATDA